MFCTYDARNDKEGFELLRYKSGMICSDGSEGDTQQNQMARTRFLRKLDREQNTKRDARRVDKGKSEQILLRAFFLGIFLSSSSCIYLSLFDFTPFINILIACCLQSSTEASVLRYSSDCFLLLLWTQKKGEEEENTFGFSAELGGVVL